MKSMLKLDLSLERDVKLLITSIGIVSLALGFMQVAQSIYLAMIGIPPVLIGLLHTVSNISHSARMLLFGILSDKIGRRRILFLMLILQATYYLIYCFNREFPLFLFAALIGAGPVEGFGGTVGGVSEGVSGASASASVTVLISSGICSIGFDSSSAANEVSSMGGRFSGFCSDMIFILL